MNGISNPDSIFYLKEIQMSYALITGASKGIGKEIARELAQRKYDLILIARSEEMLRSLSSGLSKEYSVKCEFLATDLSTIDGVDKAVSFIKSLSVELSILVNNAGYGLWGRFDELDYHELNSLMNININLPVTLTYRLIPELKKSKQSYILNIASTTAYQAIPKLAVYAACKSFLIQFSRALHYELLSSNISVTCVSPGTTDTNFMDAAGMNSESLRKKADKVKMTPSAVAKFAVESMFRKKKEAIPGWLNKISVALIPFLPKVVSEKIAAGIYDV
jgi:short-subunit dehydrogenase